MGNSDSHRKIIDFVIKKRTGKRIEIKELFDLKDN